MAGAAPAASSLPDTRPSHGHPSVPRSPAIGRGLLCLGHRHCEPMPGAAAGSAGSSSRRGKIIPDFQVLGGIFRGKKKHSLYKLWFLSHLFEVFVQKTNLDYSTVSQTSTPQVKFEPRHTEGIRSSLLLPHLPGTAGFPFHGSDEVHKTKHVATHLWDGDRGRMKASVGTNTHRQIHRYRSSDSGVPPPRFWVGQRKPVPNLPVRGNGSVGPGNGTPRRAGWPGRSARPCSPQRFSRGTAGPRGPPRRSHRPPGSRVRRRCGKCGRQCSG